MSAIVKHPGYNPGTKDHDLALLRLQDPLSFNQKVRPIDIWTGPLPSTPCTATGWGSTRESESTLGRGSAGGRRGLLTCPAPADGPRVQRLQEVNVSILDQDSCQRFYLGRLRASMFCAGREQGGADACQVPAPSPFRPGSVPGGLTLLWGLRGTLEDLCPV